MTTTTATLTLTESELRLMWMGTETLLEANPDDPDAMTLDAKVAAALESLGAYAGGRAHECVNVNCDQKVRSDTETWGIADENGDLWCADCAAEIGLDG